MQSVNVHGQEQLSEIKYCFYFLDVHDQLKQVIEFRSTEKAYRYFVLPST